MPEPTTRRSLWLATSPPTDYPTLAGDLETDVAIVGGGITGVTAAALLAAAGRNVVLLERARVGGGETGHTTAHLTEIIDARYTDLVTYFGEDGARLVARGNRASIAQIESLASRHGIECGFARVPAFLYAEKHSGVQDLQEELEHVRRAGISGEFTREVPLPFPTAGALRFEDQAQFHPLQFVRGLAARLAGARVRIFEDTAALQVEDAQPCRIRTTRGTVTAAHVLVAANVPVNDRVFMHTKIAAYRTYAMAAAVADAVIPPGLYWDTSDPYHYTRTQRIGDRTFLIVGGEDHKTGLASDTRERYGALESFVRERFPVAAPEYSWSGQIIEPVDRLPYIGSNPGSSAVYVATGYSGNGITFGVLAGMIVSDLILGRESPYAALFRPSRITPLASAARFVTENVDYPRHLIVDRLTTLNARRLEVEALRPGDGEVLAVDGDKYAVSCDAQTGELHVLSPVCTHLACDVRWNTAERTWDCPCHGSRFAPDGRVLNGPAVEPLEPKRLPERAGR